MDNAAENDLPVQLDEDGIPLYDESQRISQVDEKEQNGEFFVLLLR